MSPWGWILVYLVGFTLLQLLLFRYFSDGRAFGGASLGSGETSAPQSPEQGQTVRESGRPVVRDGDVPSAAEDGVRCHQCGAHNADEQMYTYCQECLAQLR